MNLIEAVLLGIVQGLTEFLPVSSSGHLVLGQALLGIDVPGVSFEVTLHLATLCAVLWVYRARVVSLAVGAVRRDRPSWVYIGLLALASVPAGLAGVLGKRWFESAFGHPLYVACALIVTGFLVYSVRFTARRAEDSVPSATQAAWVGLAQAGAILPGISRSGATVAAGAWRGVKPVAAAEFSFLMSVPAILGAGVLELGDAVGPGGPGPILLGAGFAAALLAGVAAIHLFVRMLESGSFHRFGWYCWVAGSAYLVAAALQPALR
ncbi:MAG: undecaprenyl-diphosphate phosphatase [Candidatus Palauibacterales bacterium]|jgi:undecaprenyl-diphosphatase|nr:undecaprenyl-diphosphate phosphatase [Candidatus Palauibacterales bacterium]MDP2483657.1 undecaprenyl-diphosphate phosphatase [Candidatus Palauibacterales bacterium]